jgi:DNA-directed RNA polymerase subunit RPC12/RpoP
MSDAKPTCPQCSRKIMQSVSNRCMYCGASLPEEHHLTAEE